MAICLGFLGGLLFGRENPNLWLLEFLGFPWILSSESRLINGLREIFHEHSIASPSFGAKPGRAPAVEAIQKDGIVHGASLPKFLIVSNQLSLDRHRR
jgi:hypothetical protein